MLQVSEELAITVQDVCGDGIFLRWQNDYGGQDQWYFSGNYAELVQQSNVEYFEPYNDELADLTVNIETVNIDWTETKRVYTFFDKENKEGFKQLLRSKNVQMYDSGEWVNVGVQLESILIEKLKPVGKLQIQVILPKVYTTW